MTESGGEPTRARGVSQVGETYSNHDLESVKGRRVKNKYWAGRQVMRALLPGSSGHVVGLKRYSVQQVTDR